MNKEITVKLGIVPVKRGEGFTTPENAAIFKDKTFKALENLDKNVELINIDSVVKNGIATTTKEIPAICQYLRDQKIDAVFMLHTDFGSEEVIAKVAAEMKLPTLLWGPRDDAPSANGDRLRDTQCGIFASSKVLMRMGVKFTYIENCYPENPVFLKGVDDFCRAASVAKAMRGLKILKAGDRPSSFLSVMSNEDELLEKFGIEVVPVSGGRIMRSVNRLAEQAGDELMNQVSELKSRIDTNVFGDDKLKKLAAMIVFLRQEMEDNGCSGCAVECWTGMNELVGILPCQVIGELTAMGYPVACEGDILGAISSVMLHAADYNRQPSFFADLTIRHPENDNAELLWHCGPFPRTLACDASDSPCLDSGGRGQWRLKDGKLTILRFDGLGGEYSMLVGEAKTTDGPKTSGTYVWMEVDDWAKWERKVVEGPYIHHVSGMYGHYADVIQEACKYIGSVKLDRV